MPAPASDRVKSVVVSLGLSLYTSRLQTPSVSFGGVSEVFCRGLIISPPSFTFANASLSYPAACFFLVRSLKTHLSVSSGRISRKRTQKPERYIWSWWLSNMIPQRLTYAGSSGQKAHLLTLAIVCPRVVKQVWRFRRRPPSNNRSAIIISIDGMILPVLEYA
jgi:hypothetical protein